MTASIVTKRHCLTKQYEYAGAQMTEFGLLRQISSRHYAKKYPERKNFRLHNLNMTDMANFFVILLYGIFSSSIVVLCEVFLHRCSKTLKR